MAVMTGPVSEVVAVIAGVLVEGMGEGNRGMAGKIELEHPIDNDGMEGSRRKGEWSALFQAAASKKDLQVKAEAANEVVSERNLVASLKQASCFLLYPSGKF
ncbi:hypothetical protein PISMIDRAFT_14184 [Pisolithus microcarpus 441]|uniref:Uncharacterized protein n=1 Tax=Pisolithus microcarpus 441 TaxID=765257 RepID=A0A0C9Z8G4_9AGAM|nr:hypothetical protein PISMIDRAFT_14184 [Pisolithus microcarpus 441]